jgi:alkylated DNA repair protein (DNA oxidative demethylase)
MEEAALLDVNKTLPFGAFHMHGVDAKRRVVRFGLHYVAGSAALTAASDLPLSLEPLRGRAAAVAGVPTHVLSESLITEYTPGTGIGWHLDAPPFGILAGISFGGRCRMRFQRREGQQRQTWTIELPPRSLYVLSGVAREEWQAANIAASSRGACGGDGEPLALPLKLTVPPWSHPSI